MEQVLVREHKEVILPIFTIKYTLKEFIEYQLRILFGAEAKNFSKGEFQVLSLFYIYSNVKEVKIKILELGLRTSNKSVDNDITKFKDLEIIEIDSGVIKFNKGLKIYKDPSQFIYNLVIV